jgi:hypothetical protein
MNIATGNKRHVLCASGGRGSLIDGVRGVVSSSDGGGGWPQS